MKGYRSLIYRFISSMEMPVPSIRFFQTVMYFQDKGFVNFILHLKELVSSMIKYGCPIEFSEVTMRKRRKLDLPDLNFDQTEIKKIAAAHNLKVKLVG